MPILFGAFGSNRVFVRPDAFEVQPLEGDNHGNRETRTHRKVGGACPSGL